ncbi:MAG: EamA family transporter, partial [Burkholderiaceae bacterium]
MSPSNWALLLVSAASFASSIILNKLLIGALPPFTLAAVRVVLALPFCLAALALAGLRLPRSWADRLTVIKVSLGVIVVPYCALVIGQQTIPGGVS